MALGTLDISIIIIYFIILLLIGYFSSRKQKEEDFLIAERKLGTWRTMFTVNASKVGSILMTFVALVFLWGLAAVWFFIGIILGMLIFLPFAIRLRNLSKGRYYTLADYFKYNFGRKAAKFASVGGIILLFGYLVLNLIAGAKIFVFFTEWSFWVGAIIMIIIVLVYILLAGYRAVVKTDVIQYIAIFIIMALMAGLLFQGSLIPPSEWNIFTLKFMDLIGFLLAGTLSAFALPDLWQRVYSAKTNKELKRGWLLSIVVYAITVFLLSLVALTVKSRFPGVDPDFALIHAFANLLPAGLVGLAVILLFAAIMSSADTYIFTSASSAIQDFFKGNKKEIIKKMRKAIFIIAILATLIAILIQNLVIGSYIFVSFVIVIAVQVIATWIKKDINRPSLLFGFTFGYITLAICIISSFVGDGFKPIFVSYVLGGSILGLIFGKIFSSIRKKQ